MYIYIYIYIYIHMYAEVVLFPVVIELRYPRTQAIC